MGRDESSKTLKKRIDEDIKSGKQSVLDRYLKKAASAPVSESSSLSENSQIPLIQEISDDEEERFVMEKFNYGNLDQRHREITEKYVRKLMRLHSTKDVPKEKTKRKRSDPSEVIEIKEKRNSYTLPQKQMVIATFDSLIALQRIKRKS